MPTLNWIGKDKVVSHHRDVPFRILEHQYSFNAQDGENVGVESESGNKIIHGDNLEALKSLLPEYEGKVKCIYIDPPYNTGKENWVYNDNVNHPKIKKWLGEIVGKEGDDLSRHDKWLCMMYPRLKLLHSLLSNDGLIFISIDDNEYQSLKLIMDEIFGKANFIANFTWRTDGNFDNQAKIKINHEYILCFGKKAVNFEYPNVIDPNIGDNSKLFKKSIRNTIVKNGFKNPISEVLLPAGFPASFEKGIIKKRNDAWPHYLEDAVVENFKLKNDVVVRSGWSSKGIFQEYINNCFHDVKDSKGQNTRFEIIKTGAIENIKKRENQSHVISSLYNMGSTQNMSSQLAKMGISFDYPKPVNLVTYLLSLVNTKDHIILDSFAGSGTTAHATLQLNKNDNGNRKFILIEMEDYANSLTSERVKKVAKGYGTNKDLTVGLGGEFDYYELGIPLFDENQNLNEEVCIEKIREYIWYSETRSAFSQENNEEDSIHYLGKKEDTVYYFIYEKDELTTLDYDILSTLKTSGEEYIIYADNCLLPKEFMINNRIIFKKIPRDITRF